MNTNRTASLIGLFAIALGHLLVLPSLVGASEARRAPRHFDLVNATFDSVMAVAIAPARSDAFQDIPIGQPLRGGLASITVDLPVGACLRDLRITFHGGRTQRFAGIDVCRTSGLRLMPRQARPLAPEA